MSGHKKWVRLWGRAQWMFIIFTIIIIIIIIIITN